MRFGCYNAVSQAFKLDIEMQQNTVEAQPYALNVRISQEMRRKIDEFRKTIWPIPNTADAARMLLERGLGDEARKSKNQS